MRQITTCFTHVLLDAIQCQHALEIFDIIRQILTDTKKLSSFLSRLIEKVITSSCRENTCPMLLTHVSSQLLEAHRLPDYLDAVLLLPLTSITMGVSFLLIVACFNVTSLFCSPSSFPMFYRCTILGRCNVSCRARVISPIFLTFLFPSHDSLLLTG